MDRILNFIEFAWDDARLFELESRRVKGSFGQGSGLSERLLSFPSPPPPDSSALGCDALEGNDGWEEERSIEVGYIIVCKHHPWFPRPPFHPRGHSLL